MATLIVYLVLILGVVGSLYGFVHSHDSGVRAEQDAVWKPKLEAAAANEAVLSTANKALSADFEVLGAKYKEQGEAVSALKKQSDDAMARAKAWEAKARANDAKAAKKEAELAAILAAPPEKDRTKDCDAAEALIDDAIAGRLRND